MKAYLIPFRFDRRIAVGSPDGWKIEGPILYAPNKGIILYKSAVQGYTNDRRFITADVVSFEDSPLILDQLERQIRGQTLLLLDGYYGLEFDLSEGVIEVEVSDLEIDTIAAKSNESHDVLRKFAALSLKLVGDLEERVGREKIYQRLE